MMDKKRIKELLADALEQARNVAIKDCNGYIALNPTHEKERKRDLMIEMAGINNLYYAMLDQINSTMRV